MLRIALILALLAAIGSLTLSILVTKPTVTDLRDNLASTSQQLSDTQATLETTKADLKKTSTELASTSTDLESTRAQLEEVSATAATTKRRADSLEANLTKTTREKNEAQAELAQWQALGIKPDQVTQMRVDLKQANEEKDALSEEKVLFLRNISQLKARLLKYEEPETKIALPSGLKGNILAVGPQQDFVLLDIGANNGVLERGEMVIRRGDKLIGKVSIVSVEPTRSIANILPAWRQGDVTVADTDKVLY
jgi:hypothetical protein